MLTLQQENIKYRIGAKAFHELEENIKIFVDAGGNGEQLWDVCDYLSTFANQVTPKELLSEMGTPPNKKIFTPDWMRLNKKER